MERVIKIKGGHRLNGSLKISGAKNTTVAIIPTAVLAQEEVRIVGIPDISDVEKLVSLLEQLNCRVKRVGTDELIIDPTPMKNIELVGNDVTKLRASYYFMGALLGKYKEVTIRMSGGCDLGPRPIDLHLKGFEALGASINYSKGVYHLKADKLVGNKIFLDFASVGATINIMLAAVYAEGRTIIENAAKEPEIIDVANMLNNLGANIRGAGTNIITIDGTDYLGGCFHEVIPDRIEAGTYIIMAAAAGDDVIIENVIPLHMEALLSKLQDMNVNLEVGPDWIRIRKNGSLKAVDVQTGVYPGLATDVQQPLATLMSQASGTSKIVENIYVERFKNCFELEKMGADIEVRSGQALINGPTSLEGCDVIATDLRGGASVVIAGLIAEGETIIHEIFHIERGYEGIVEKLTALGADIKIEEV
ncbi:MAG: UDP-N-acetylglucosamine 1-carboxyvinyltransferase [Erysipelotrichaceae bacterium]